MSVIESTKISKTNGGGGGVGWCSWAGSLSSCGAGMCLFEIAVFEVDASQNLSQALAFKKKERKTVVRAYTTV